MICNGNKNIAVSMKNQGMRYLIVGLLLTFLLSCKKDKGEFITGTVIDPGGCFGDSYLVAIDHPDLARHVFLRPAVICPSCYNSGNAVFMSVPATLNARGTRIKFVFTQLEISCLSSSEAPSHISVKKLSRL